jgi:5'-3' exonuclease
MNVLCDFSQVVISGATQYFTNTKEDITLDKLRTITLTTILSYRKKFKVANDKLWICFDGRNYWRKDIFPNYKQNRKKAHAADEFDWNTFYKYFNQIKTEFVEELPYPTLEVPGCEADDIFAILSQILTANGNNVIIISSDKDLLQIQNICRPGSVKQWSYMTKKFITVSTYSYDLFDHIARGDRGDGIPNVISDDDTFLVEAKRQKTLTKKTLEGWKKKFPTLDAMCSLSPVASKFSRNRQLIDLTQISEKHKLAIKQAYMDIEQPDLFTFGSNRKDAFDYLVKHKLTQIMDTCNF